MRAREVIAILEAAGWYEVRHKGGHKQFKHPTHKGLVTVSIHPGDLKRSDLISIERQSGLRLR